MPYSDNYYENLSHLLRFFTREEARGYVFGASVDQRLIRYINEELKERAKEKGTKLKILFPEYESDVPIMEQIRRAAAEADGLIISNLDELILKSNGDVLLHLNFSRESLQALDKPLLFWASQDNLSRIANQAGDLFSQRALSTFTFDEQALMQHQSQAMEARFADEGYKTKEEYKELELKIKLLEKQLTEAEAEGLPPGRIADSLALPLADVYRNNQMIQAALGLVERYGALGTSNVKNLRIIGDVYEQANVWDKAIDIYKQAIKIAKPEDRIELATLYNQIASVYWGMGCWDEAVNWNKKSIAIKEEILDKDDPRLANSYFNLGMVYLDQQDFEKALACFHLSCAIRERILSHDHPDLGQVYSGLGLAYQELGKLKKALKYHLKANAIANKAFDSDHPNLAASYHNLGLIYSDQGEQERALEYYLKAISITEKVFGPHHPKLATSYNNIAWAYFDLGNYAQAEIYMKKAITIRKMKLPEGHPDLEDSLKRLKKIEAKIKEQ